MSKLAHSNQATMDEIEAKYKDDEPLVDLPAWAKFLRESARYFRNRPTNGEDKAFWANCYNAMNCEDIAAYLEALHVANATATPQDGTTPATSPQSAATAAIRPPTNTTPTPVPADARSHEAPTRTAGE